MHRIAAYLLLQLGGTMAPSAADIERVLGSVGVETDKRRLQQFLVAIRGKDVTQFIQEGSAKLAVVRTSSKLVRDRDVQESPPRDNLSDSAKVQVRTIAAQ